MKYRIVIETDNDAFYDGDGQYDPAPEIAGILEELAEKIRAGRASAPVNLRDSNGNTVGRASMTRR